LTNNRKGGKIDSIFIQKITKLGLDCKTIGINNLTNGIKVDITMKMLEKAEHLCIDVAYLFDKSFKEVFRN